MGRSVFCARSSHAVRQRLAERGADIVDTERAEFVLVAEDGAEPDAVLACWEKRDEAELVVGARRVRRGARNRIYRRLLKLPYYDFTSGVRLYRASALRRSGGDIDHPLEALVRLHHDGFKIKELPVPSRPSAPNSGLFEAVRLRRRRFAASGADADDRAYDGRKSRLKERLEQIVSFLEVDVPLVDVGCGSGRLIQSIAKGVGLDVDVKKLRYLRGRAPGVVAGSVRHLPFRDACLPQVVCSDVLHRIPAGELRIAELYRVLRPGGTLVVGAPDASRWTMRLRRLFSGDEVNPYSEARMRQELEENGFVIDDVRHVRGGEMIVRAVRRDPRRAAG